MFVNMKSTGFSEACVCVCVCVCGVLPGIETGKIITSTSVTALAEKVG